MKELPIDAPYEACALLLQLRNQNLTVRVAGEAGLVVSPKSGITPSLREEIATHARELARLVSDQHYFKRTLNGLRKRQEAVEECMSQYISQHGWPTPDEPLDIVIVDLFDDGRPVAIFERRLDAVAESFRRHSQLSRDRSQQLEEQVDTSQKKKGKKGKQQQPTTRGLFANE